jgi:arylsulfatase A-like enzyme
VPKKKLPNIILIVLDTARAKSFSCYGYHRKTTPNIDRIAEEGVLYRWCFAPSNWTLPCHASLFTGLYPVNHGCNAYSLYLYENIPALPEILQNTGYNTVGISCNGLVSEPMGFRRGFNVFKECWGLGFSNFFLKGETRKERVKELIDLLRGGKFRALGRWFATRFLKNRLSVITNSVPYTRKALGVVKKVLKELLGHSSGPLFLFINLMGTHAVYNPPHPFRGTWSSRRMTHQKALGEIKAYPDYYDFYARPELQGKVNWAEITNFYDEELCFVDSVIGHIFEMVESAGFKQSTFFVITSDHGEMLGEHGLYGHIWGLYNEVIHIPMIISFPEFGFGRIVENPVQLHDLFATILEIADIPYPTPKDSISLCSSEKRTVAMSQDVDSEMDLVHIMGRNPDLSLTSPWASRSCAVVDEALIKAIATPSGYRELYDLRSDYLEEKNLGYNRKAETTGLLLCDGLFAPEGQNRKIPEQERVGDI